MTLADNSRQMGIELDETHLAAFDRYQAELLDWNQRFNLTSITDPAEIEVKHFLDSLSCLLALPAIDRRPVAQWLQTSLRAVDIGAGAGFPGLPLKIVWPGLRLTLLETTGKKCRFLQHMVAVLGLADVDVVQSRAEVFGQGAGRQAFDLALGRAVTRLPALLEYALPLLRVGGWFIAQKGRDPQEEVLASQVALETLGGSYHDSLPVAVPGLDASRTLVLVAKAGPTPAAYPRRPGIPERQPLS